MGNEPVNVLLPSDKLGGFDIRKYEYVNVTVAGNKIILEFV